MFYQIKTSHLQKIKDGEHKINVRITQNYMQNLRKAEIQNEPSLTKVLFYLVIEKPIKSCYSFC